MNQMQDILKVREMKITELKTRAKSTRDSPVERARKEVESAQAGAQGSGVSDSVDLSGANEVQGLTQVAMKSSSGTMSIDEIKAAIREGRYRVDYEKRAERLLEDPSILG